MTSEELKHLVKSLAETPKAVWGLVKSLPYEDLRYKPATQGFSCLEHVCHLRDIEREGFAVRIWKLLHEKQPFLSDIDGDKLAQQRNYNDQNIVFALGEFRQARDQNVHAISDLSTDQLQRGGTFEGLGSITLEKLLIMMLEHDDEHLRELSHLRSQLIKEER